jgi:Domain of unknown function (DUF4091)
LRFTIVLIALGACTTGWALDLRAAGEFSRPDPYGGIVTGDHAAGELTNAVRLSAARGGYASFHLIALGRGSYELSLRIPLATDLYREWFHLNNADGKYYPDALIPVRPPFRSTVPDPLNRIEKQTAQAFWVDVWIPADARPGDYRGEARLSGEGGGPSVVSIQISVTQAVIPETDAVLLDNNSYGTSWMLDQYPQTLAALREGTAGEDALFRLIQAYHRMFYDHRGVFHQLGYGHAGKVGPEFAPELQGSGRDKHIASWDRFDRHYGPLLDGSAFRESRRGPRPIPYVYLPINPEWPASFLWWGEPGYEAEFVNVVSEMERHFREKGWTTTRFEVFFNQKKRYKGFNWDGDEVRFDRDNRYFAEYGRMLSKALPKDSPVHFVMRADTSWTMEHQMKELQNIVRLWVAGEGTSSWYPEALAAAKRRGDTVWTYGGTPEVRRPLVAMTLNPLRSWISGVDGFVRWLTVSPGPDPWFHFGGGGETLVYPGERFGVPAPLASIRLKIQRNCLQDLALLEEAGHRGSREQVQSEVVRRYNGTALPAWRNTRPKLAATPVLEWTNADIEDALRGFEARFAKLDPDAWLRVREFAITGARP